MRKEGGKVLIRERLGKANHVIKFFGSLLADVLTGSTLQEPHAVHVLDLSMPPPT